MAYETIVAVYDAAEQADRAVHDLEASGVPSSSITRHAGTHNAGSSRTTSTAGTASQEEPGFWARLFGSDTDYEHEGSMYDRSVQGGSTVVSVRVAEEHAMHVMDILERHNPVDLDDSTTGMETTSNAGRVNEDLHGANAGIGGTGVGTRSQTASGTSASVGSGGTGMVGGVGSGVSAAGAGTRADADTSDTLAGGLPVGMGSRATTGTGTGREDVIPLSEEELAVGKRRINRGTTRVRRYVVETPVEEAVSLRDETVSVDRRPVSGERTVGDDAFTDKVVEVSESSEEAVVSKTAHVREEVVINKQADERTETVRDTVRREDVEISKDPGTATGSTTDPARR